MRSQKVFRAKLSRLHKSIQRLSKSKKTNSEDEKGLANLADYHEKKDQGKLTVEEIKVWDAMGELLMIHNTIVKNDRHELDNADSGVKK